MEMQLAWNSQPNPSHKIKALESEIPTRKLLLLT